MRHIHEDTRTVSDPRSGTRLTPPDLLLGSAGSKRDRPMAEHKPPQGSTGDKPVPTHASDPRSDQQHAAQQSAAQSQRGQPQQSQRPSPSDSQKSQIRDYFRSQGRQPEDVIWDLQGLQLRLRDLD